MPPRKKKKIESTKDILQDLNISVDDSLKSTIYKLADKGDRLKDEDVWETNNLLTFEEFCASPEHMAFPPLSQKQKDFALYLLGNDPKKIFDNNRTLAVCVFGKGSGKDMCSALIQLYVVYILLNLKDPQWFLNKSPKTSNIDLLNVASSKELAESVYFNLLKNFVKNWVWARNKWKMVVNGRFYGAASDDIFESDEKIIITNDSIVFPKNIRMISGSSEAESSEGRNILMYVLDEADAFKDGVRSASRIFRVCRTSSSSRFGNKAKGVVISYPRTENGFIMSLYKYSKNKLNIWGDIGATWEVKPRHLFSKEEFEFEGVRIPMDFYDDFMFDPIGAKATYMCKPPKSNDGFFDDMSVIDASTMSHPGPLAVFIDDVNDYTLKVVKKFNGLTREVNPGTQYVLCFDLGEKTDSTALCVAHRSVDKIIIDFVTDWRPIPKKNIKVDLQNVADVIKELDKSIHISHIGCDHWNSAIILQALSASGIDAKNVRLTFEDYNAFKRYLNGGFIILPPHERLINELKQLQLVNGSKVDHPDGGHNDLAVTVIMATKMLMVGASGTGMFKNSMANTGTFIEQNLHKEATSGSVLRLSPMQSNGISVDGFILKNTPGNNSNKL